MTKTAPFSQVQDLSTAFARLVGIAAFSLLTRGRAASSGGQGSSSLPIEALSEEGDFAVTLPGWHVPLSTFVDYQDRALSPQAGAVTTRE